MVPKCPLFGGFTVYMCRCRRAQMRTLIMYTLYGGSRRENFITPCFAECGRRPGVTAYNLEPGLLPLEYCNNTEHAERYMSACIILYVLQ